MRVYDNGSFFTVQLSSSDTYNWAHRAGAYWPCSSLSGRRVSAQFDKRSGDIVDLTIDGGRGDQDCPANELSAIMADLAGKRFPVLAQ